VEPGDLRVAVDLANEILVEAPPADAVKLVEAYQETFQKSCVQLQAWKTTAEREQLPFVALLEQCLVLIQTLLTQDGVAAFCRTVREQQEALERLCSKSSSCLILFWEKAIAKSDTPAARQPQEPCFQVV
jgi:hypothetical protein